MKEKERLELKRTTPETANPFQMMRRFTNLPPLPPPAELLRR